MPASAFPRLSQVPAKSLTDFIAGGLLGVAAGDALGATVEFMSPAEIQRRHGVHRDIVGGGAFGWRPGQGTDDTDLTWAVVAGYLKTGGSESLEAIAQEFLEWFETDPPDVGITTRQALLQLRHDGNPATSGLTSERSCGNGSLMRALPTALVRSDSTVRQAESAQISVVTHAHRRCVDSCVAYNEIAAALLHGCAAVDAIGAAHELDLDAEVRRALDTPATSDVEQLGTGGYVIDSLACAVWAIQQSQSLESVLVSLVNRGDDADTTGAIAGGLLGVQRGVDAIPERWRDKLEYADRMCGAADELARMRSAT